MLLTSSSIVRAQEDEAEAAAVAALERKQEMDAASQHQQQQVETQPNDEIPTMQGSITNADVVIDTDTDTLPSSRSPQPSPAEQITPTLNQNANDENLCPRNCSGHGKCLAPAGSHQHICVCDEGYEDKDCGIKTTIVESSSNMPSMWPVLFIFLLAVGVERVWTLYRKQCGHGSRIHGRDTYSGVSPLDDQLDQEEFGDESINDRL